MFVSLTVQAIRADSLARFHLPTGHPTSLLAAQAHGELEGHH